MITVATTPLVIEIVLRPALHARRLPAESRIAQVAERARDGRHRRRLRARGRAASNGTVVWTSRLP